MNRLLLAEVERTPLERSLPRLRRLVSPLTGIVAQTQQLLPAPDDPRLVHVTATLADARGVIGSGANRDNGGIHFRPDAALAAAIGECIERYGGAYLRADDCRTATARELGDAAARPASFALFHPRQYAAQHDFVPFDEDTRLSWRRAYRLPGGEPAFVPTQLASLASGDRHEPHIGYPTSSGMACGATREEAILSGLFELVERDAFLITWYNRLSLPRIELLADKIIADDHRRYYESTQIAYTALDLSTILGIPTALAVCRDERGAAAMAVGCASAATLRDAARKAIREAFQTRVFARQLRVDQPDWSCDDPSTIDSFDEHVLFYTTAANARQAAFLDASAETAPLSGGFALEGTSVTAHIACIVERLSRAGVTVCVVDTTPPDIAAAGLHTVAVVTPELCRLDVAYRHRYLGGTRLYDASFAAGLLPEPLTFDGINPLPHPFP